ncbi:hypothetical protein GCM10028787_27180 [Brachybacterium horti]
MRSSLLSRSATAAAAALLLIGLAGCGSGSASSSGETAEAATSASDGGTSDAGASEATNTEAADSAAGSADVEPGECEVKEGSSTIPSSTPQVDGWTMVAGVSVPTSTAVGPFVQEDDLWSCYEHSAEGALFAMAYEFAATGNVDGFADVWIPEGEFHDGVVGEEQKSQGSTLAEMDATLVGYRYQSYSEDSASADIATEVVVDGQSAIVYIKVALQWRDGRWMVDPENVGDQAIAIESLDGFVPWRA